MEILSRFGVFDQGGRDDRRTSQFKSFNTSFLPHCKHLSQEKNGCHAENSYRKGKSANTWIYGREDARFFLLFQGVDGRCGESEGGSGRTACPDTSIKRLILINNLLMLCAGDVSIGW
jgi:hypothetical protein